MKKHMVVSVTGHRDMVETDLLEEELKMFFSEMCKQYDEVTLLSALATGADSFVAKIFLDLGYENFHLEIPLPLPKAKYIETVNEAYFLQLSDRANRMYEIPKVLKDPYENLAHYLVDNAEILLALWDGTDNGKIGGTADVVAYAKSQKKPIKHLRIQRKNH